MVELGEGVRGKSKKCNGLYGMGSVSLESN